MRLMKDDGHGNFSLVEHHNNDIPSYAILSHTWGADGEEVTFRDLIEGTGKNKAGYKKIEFCKNQAASDDLQFFWVDTCCIDKSSSVELNEAINSMFRWNKNANKCYVYLSDVSKSEHATNVSSSPNTWEAAFRKSRWFGRGWTLQELIAPVSVDFFSSEGDPLGSKRSLEQHIHEITEIAIEALHGGPLTGFTVEERFSWAKHRKTKRQEDQAYSLFGIFDVHMSLFYGEGREKAFLRLRRKIDKSLKSPIEQPETLPSPSSTVPFRRDVDFVDRGTLHDCGTLLEHIEQRCRAAASRVALVGIGGAGKSQLAIEYCHRLRERSPKTWVFWIHASNADRIRQGYHEIAERVKIPGHNDPKEDIFELVARWLQDESKGTWVLVLDNLDDDSVLSIPQVAASRAQLSDREDQFRRPLSAYFPQSQNGVILITTRTRNVATKLVEPRDVIVVDPMTDIDAITLLKMKLDVPIDDNDLRELTWILEYMPLAIVQAAAYIQQKGVRYSVRQYIEAFQRNEKRKTSLLNYEAGHLRRDPEAKNSIITTWQISFDDIREKWPSSADLLSLMSFFDRQGIPKEALKVQSQKEEDIRDSMSQKGDGFENDKNDEDEDSGDGLEDDEDDEDKDIRDDDTSNASGDDMFEETVDRLRSYSFVSLGKDETLFEMHGLVQLATREWLAMHQEDEKWRAQFSRNLNAVLPTGNHENWARCETLFPHVKSAERQRPLDDRSVREWAQLLRKGGWYAWARGEYCEAESMCEKSVRALRKVVSREEVETSYSLGMLALIFSNQGRWKEAEELNVQVIETRKRVLGQEHPDTLTSIANLASTYRNQGRWKEAEELFVQVMETSLRVLGQEHPDTLISIANLASTYRNQGRLKEAEELDVQVMEKSLRVLGQEHPDTLTSIANLASTFWNQRRWKKAEELFVQVMETSLRVLGQEHPDTLTSIANLASTYRNQGRWKEAEELFVQVMEMRKRVLGQEHPDTLFSINNLAVTMKEQGRKEEAIKLMMECVQLQNRVLPAEHLDALSSAAALAQWQSVE